MPGFAIKLEESKGSFSKTVYFIDKQTYCPIRIYQENYSKDDPGQKFYLDQIYYDIQYNLKIDEAVQFDTWPESTSGYHITEKLPIQMKKPGQKALI